MTRREMLGATAAALVLPLLESRLLAALTRYTFAGARLHAGGVRARGRAERHHHPDG